MKKLLYTTLILFAVAVAGCKKDSTNNNNNNNVPGWQSFTVPVIPPSQPGILQVSQSSITIREGQSIQLNAIVFNSDGSTLVNQPSMFWNSDNTQVASVNSGLVNGVSVGNATVSVTDGTHGIVYVSVTVVDAGTTIASTATDITFTPPVLVLPKGGSGTFTYTAKNQTGQTVPISPTFISSNAITVSNGNVTAGNTVGDYFVTAVIGSDTLNGVLHVIVFDPAIPSADTTYKITRLINFPIAFNKNNLTSAPFRIEVTKSFVNSNGIAVVSKFQTSPESVSIEFPSVLSMNSNGAFTSVAAGGTGVKFTYRGQTINGRSSVFFNPAGTWGGGDLSICIDEVTDRIMYFNSFYTGISYSAKVFLKGCNNNQPVSKSGYRCIDFASGHYNGNGDMIFAGALSGLKKQGDCAFGFAHQFNDCSKSINDATYISETQVKCKTSFGDVNLTKGTGSCAAQPTSDNYITVDGTKYFITTDDVTNVSSDADCFSYYASAVSLSPAESFTTLVVYKPVGSVSSGEFSNTSRTLTANTDCSSTSLCHLVIYTSNGTSYSSSNGSVQLDATNTNYLTFSGSFNQSVNGNSVGTKVLSGKIRRYKP